MNLRALAAESEEIPARMQAKAKEDLARLFNDALSKAGLAAQGRHFRGD